MDFTLNFTALVEIISKSSGRPKTISNKFRFNFNFVFTFTVLCFHVATREVSVVQVARGTVTGTTDVGTGRVVDLTLAPLTLPVRRGTAVHSHSSVSPDLPVGGPTHMVNFWTKFWCPGPGVCAVPSVTAARRLR